MPSGRGRQTKNAQKLLLLAQQELAERLPHRTAEVAELVKRWQDGQLEETEAVQALFKVLDVRN